jgi:hypothetical protein
MISDPKRKTLAFVTEIDEAELAVRLISRAIGLERPTGELAKSAREYLADAEKNWPPGCGPFPFGDMARIAIEYFRECIEKGQRSS